jgi:membrane associated rhomboid family serine protease
MGRDQLALRIQCLYLPVIGIACAMLVGYSLLNWLLIARTNLVPVADNVVDYWLPAGASWVLVLAFVQPRFRLFKADIGGNLGALSHVAAVAVIAVPTVIAQGYIRTAAGEVTRVMDVRDVAAAPVTKYYIADTACVSYSGTVAAPVLSTMGRYNDTVVVDLYAAEPLCSSGGWAGPDRTVWIGLTAHTSFSSSLGTQERRAALSAFAERADAHFRAEDVRSYRFYSRVGRSADGKGFAAALRRAMPPIDDATAVVLVPHKEPFEARSGDRLPWTFGSFAIGAVAWLALVMLRPLKAKKMAEWDSLKATKNPRNLVALALVVPSRKSYGLPILIDVNLAVFGAMVLAGLGFVSFDTDDLIRWGGNYGPALHGWGALRLVSSQFLHSGLMHLANNLYGLLFAGMFLLPITGNAGLIVCYLVCGLGGSITSAVVHPATVSVGASGAIFGLFGALLTLLLLRDNRIASVRGFLLMNAGIFVALNLFLGSVSRGIDNAAHLGGLATGILVGAAIFTSGALRR